MRNNKRTVKIFDTTLRDGEQSPGASMTLDEKIQIAASLERMGVDVIEAGFSAASKGDFESVQAVANKVKNSVVCALARANENDIKSAGTSLAGAAQGRIHTFIATSPVHMEKKLQLTPEEVLDISVKSVALARNLCADVEFSCEDAGRSDFDFLCKVIEAAINAGASTINIPDTVGYTMPEEFGSLVKRLIMNIVNSDKVIFSAHCHNDLGLAVANSLSAISHGAGQVECTINGIGERAGNASLEEIVMALKVREDVFFAHTNIDTTKIIPVSKLVSSITGFAIQPNKAIVGANAFAHEAGIHQDGVIKHRETYEIMKAEDVGWSANKLVLGKHSGRNAFVNKLKELEIEFANQEEVNKAFAKFKEIADMKHEISTLDLQTLFSKNTSYENNSYTLSKLSVIIDSGKPALAKITLKYDEKHIDATSQGDGPVAAVYSAIEKIVSSSAKLLLYSIVNVTDGIDAIGEVMVRLEKEGAVVNGTGADPDIVTASAMAYLNALEKLKQGARKVSAQKI